MTLLEANEIHRDEGLDVRWSIYVAWSTLQVTERFSSVAPSNFGGRHHRGGFKPRPYAHSSLCRLILYRMGGEELDAKIQVFSLLRDSSWKTHTTTLELLATDHVILNHGQVTWTTPELAPPSPNYHTTPMGGRFSSRQI
ncbi:hypothetical protein TNCV_3005931 [Trichonephila clavipes]|nr:hypothetical protein TNCV_3005931 [Trichonephila clavipes]